MKPSFLLCFLFLPLRASAQWEARMSGLPTDGAFQEVALADSSTAWVYASSKIYQTTDLGRTWTVASTPAEYGYASVMATWTNTTLIYGTHGGKIVRTTDGGAHWAVVFNDSSVTTFINDLVMFDSLQGFAMGDPPDSTKRPGLLTTSDGGASWQVVPNDLPAGDIQIRDRTSFVRPDLGWTKVRSDGIYKTTNGGINWQRIYTPLAPHTIYFLNDSVGFYSTFGSPTGLYKTTDGGLTWAQKLFVAPLHWVRWAPGGEVLWAGRDTLYKSTDMGESWQAVLKNASGTFQDAAFFKDDVGVVVGMSAVLALDPNPVFITTQQEPVASGFSLQQNYPNPFNPSTTIGYALPHRSHVSLSVFNTLGQRVATLIDGEMEAGYHEVQFDGSGLSSGMYFCRLQVQSFTQARTLCLIK